MSRRRQARSGSGGSVEGSSLWSRSGRTVAAAVVLAVVSAGLLIWATLPALQGDGGGASDGGRVISVAEAHELVEAREGVLVDTRGPQSFEQGRAAGAVLAPLAEIEADPNLPVITQIPDELAMILYCT